MRTTTRCLIACALTLLCATRGAAQVFDTGQELSTPATTPAVPDPSADSNDPESTTPEAAAATAVDAAPTEETPAEPEATGGFRGFLQDNLAIHGFGTFQTGWTRVREGLGNHYAFGDNNGDFEHLNFSLRELVQATPELRFFAGQSFTIADGDLLVELDLAGAQYSPTNWFDFRVGRILSPVGIYTEVYRVGTLRPFGNLPTSVYGNAGFIAQSFDGGEAQFTLGSMSGWNTRLSVFLGHSHVTQDDALVRAVEGSYLGLIPKGSLSNDIEAGLLIGGNVRVDTPIEGLGFAFGAMGSTPRYTNLVGGAVPLHENNLELIGSAYYLRDKLEIRSEFAYRRNHDPDTGKTLANGYGMYLEVAYRLLERVQVAVRYERYGIKLMDLVDLQGDLASLKQHQDIGAVASYWFTRDFVLKLEYHFVDGNRFAHPVDVYSAVANMGALAKKTHFVGFTSQFSF